MDHSAVAVAVAAISLGIRQNTYNQGVGPCLLTCRAWLPLLIHFFTVPLLTKSQAYATQGGYLTYCTWMMPRMVSPRQMLALTIAHHLAPTHPGWLPDLPHMDDAHALVVARQGGAQGQAGELPGGAGRTQRAGRDALVGWRQPMQADKLVAVGVCYSNVQQWMRQRAGWRATRRCWTPWRFSAAAGSGARVNKNQL